jgi:hypothetical protein
LTPQGINNLKTLLINEVFDDKRISVSCTPCVKISIVQRLIIEKIARHNGISMAEATRELIAAGIEVLNVE